MPTTSTAEGSTYKTPEAFETHGAKHVAEWAIQSEIKQIQEERMSL